MGNACSDTVSDGPIPAGSCDSSGIRLRSEAWVSLGASPRRAPQKERLKIPRSWLPQDGSHLAQHAQRRIGAAVLGMASKLQLPVWVKLVLAIYVPVQPSRCVFWRQTRTTSAERAVPVGSARCQELIACVHPRVHLPNLATLFCPSLQPADRSTWF